MILALYEFIRIWGVARPVLSLGLDSRYSIWEHRVGVSVCRSRVPREEELFLRSGDDGGYVCMQGQRKRRGTRPVKAGGGSEGHSQEAN